MLSQSVLMGHCLLDGAGCSDPGCSKNSRCLLKSQRNDCTGPVIVGILCVLRGAMLMRGICMQEVC